ncbi:MAG: sulfatase-like hydrolase/transferase [Candidatus Omnitrophica bacterium]|nr:sulfatase-like hydrolase/transferase [Candidatus Omnitrophota bacterium]
MIRKIVLFIMVVSYCSICQAMDIYNCYKTKEKIVVDGKLLENAWKKAPELIFLDMVEGSVPALKTTAGMNFTRGFLQWEFVRGIEGSIYHSPSRVTPEMFAKFGGDLNRLRKPYPKYALLNNVANLTGIFSEEDTTTAKVFLWAMRFIEENRIFKPLFLFIDSFIPHEPWKAPDSYLEMYYNNSDYQGRTILHAKYTPVDDQMSEEEFKHTVAHYCGLVSMVDTWFGYFIQKLKRLGMWENSVVAVLSDHGTNFADNPERIIGKPHYGMYPGVMKIPLMIHFPEVVKGISGKLLYNIDATATIYTMAGIKNVDVDGKDLYGLVNGSEWQERKYLTCRYGDSLWYRDKNHWIIMNIDGSARSVFDLQKDQRCQKNIVSAPESKRAIEKAWKHIMEDANGRLSDYRNIEKTDALGEKYPEKR